MHRQRILLAAALAAFIVSIVAIATPRGATVQVAGVAAAPGGQGKPTPTPTPVYNVTSTIYDLDGLGNPLQLQSDDLNVNLSPTGSFLGIYQTDSSTNVTSQIKGPSESDWDLHLQSSISRSVNLTLSQLSGSGPTGAYSLHARVLSRCFDPTAAKANAATDTVDWFNITTSDPNCSMRVEFTLSGTQYVLVMSPDFANTGRAAVTCTQASGSSCFAWSILPNLTQSSINPNPTVANLYFVAKSGFKLVGTYTLTYRVNVTFP